MSVRIFSAAGNDVSSNIVTRLTFLLGKSIIVDDDDGRRVSERTSLAYLFPLCLVPSTFVVLSHRCTVRPDAACDGATLRSAEALEKCGGHARLRTT